MKLKALAGISYSQARHWFLLPGFPAIGGFVFWSDFVTWRQAHSGLTELLEQVRCHATDSEVRGPCGQNLGRGGCAPCHQIYGKGSPTALRSR
jgi:hypothetical protein